MLDVAGLSRVGTTLHSAADAPDRRYTVVVGLYPRLYRPLHLLVTRQRVSLAPFVTAQAAPPAALAKTPPALFEFVLHERP